MNPALAYFWGHDAFAVEQAARTLADELGAQAGSPLDVWRTRGDDDENATAAAARSRILDQIEQHIGTSPMFSAGTLVIVRQPGSLLAEAAARQRLIGLVAAVAPGNALCFVDLVASGSKAPAASGALRDAVAAAGGTVTEFPVLSRERMEGWIERRATQLGVTLGPGAARLLAERVGAYVREADIDRRRQSELANGELEKLSLYRPGATVSRGDIDELVEEAIPGSTWAFLDAVAVRRPADAAALAERLLAAGTPLPVLISQLHRRLRELVIVRDHLDAGTAPADLVRVLKMQPFRVQKLVEQAGRWSAAALADALAGVLELDLLSKGIGADGGPRSFSDDRSRLALIGWIGERVDGGGGPPTRPRSQRVGA